MFITQGKPVHQVDDITLYTYVMNAKSMLNKSMCVAVYRFVCLHDVPMI